MGNKSFAAKIQEWELRQNGMTANASDLAHLSAESTQFDSLLSGIKDLNTQQEALKAQTAQMTQQLNAKVAEMTKLDSRVVTSLQGKYGKTNKKLEEFGIRTPKPPTRKKGTGGTGAS